MSQLHNSIFDSMKKHTDFFWPVTHANSCSSHDHQQDLHWREGSSIVENTRVSASQLCRSQLSALYMYEETGEQEWREVLSSHGMVWCLLGSRILRTQEILNPCTNPMVPVDSLVLYYSNGKKWRTGNIRGLHSSCNSLGYYLDRWRSGILAHPK